MTWSTSCSSRAARAVAIALLSAASAGAQEPAHGRVALFPVDNVSGGSAPLRELRGAIELAVASAGLEVVSGDAVEQFLARHRVRYTGGVDGATAAQAGQELGVEGVLLTSIELYTESPPQLALTMRLAAARSDATILWIDGVSRSGIESPGLLGLGILTMQELQDRILARLARSLAENVAGRGPRARACDDGGRFGPHVRYRSPILEAGQIYSVAVVPFRNLTGRRSAGDLVTLEFLRQFAATDAFRVVEPGVIRDIVLRNRVVMEGGISVDQVRLLLGALGADLVVAGDVFDFAERAGSAPTVNFSFAMLDGRTGEIAWESTSVSSGDARVWFFGLGTVRTAPALTCRMVRTVLEEMFRTAPPPGAVRRVAPEPVSPSGPRRGEYVPPRERSPR